MSAVKDIGPMTWLACRAATHVCALPLADVIETMRPLPIESFARAPSFVAGMAVIRGEATPVVDVRLLFGEPPGDAGRFVTVRINNRIVALAFDAVIGIQTLSRNTASELPPLLKSLAGDVVSVITTRDSDFLLFFETARIFPPGLLESLSQASSAK